MKIDSTGKVVIDDKYICQFMGKHGNESFFATCESIIKSICLACEKNISNESQNDILIQRLDMFKGELIDCIGSQKFDTSEIIKTINDKKVDTNDIMSTMKTMNENNILNISSKLEQIPQIVNKIDDIRNKIDVTKVIETSVTRNNDSLVQAINTIKNSQDQMASKIDTFSIVRNTTRFKGEEGEKGIIHILENKLPMRDGYSIQEVKSIPHSCDILIKRDGFPDIRIESKAHGRESKENVKLSEVKKFESDLLSLNNHGIFVSLYSGICGKDQFDIDLLPNNKIAIYLSNNNFNGDIIISMIRMLYILDRFTSGSESGDIKVSIDTMIRVKSYLTDFNRKIEEVKTLNKNSMRLLNEISLDFIEKALIGHIPQIEKKSTPTETYVCEKCHQVCKSKSGLTNHMKMCKVSGNVTQSLHIDK